MSGKKSIIPGEFCWVELCTPDLDKALKFYQPLLRWESTVVTMPDGDQYSLLSAGGSEIAGAYQLTDAFKQQGVPPHWGSYVLVKNADQACEKAKKLGATVIKEPFDVMEFGRMAILSDPTGATFSVWQRASQDKQAYPEKKSHGMFGWNELITNDIEKAGKFYSDCFGWQLEAQTMPGGHVYTSFMQGETLVGGMFSLRDDMDPVPPHWGVYFSVDAFDKALGEATQKGAITLCDPREVEGVGRFTTLRDPQGVYFSLIQFAK